MIDLLYDELLLQCNCRIDCPFMSLSTLWIIFTVFLRRNGRIHDKEQEPTLAPISNLILLGFILRFMSEKNTICLVHVGIGYE